MTAPTVDTPADDERIKAFTVDDREACMLYAAESSPELPHVKLWYAFVAQHAALLAARREVEAARAALNGIADHGWCYDGRVTFTINCVGMGDAKRLEALLTAALAATPEEK